MSALPPPPPPPPARAGAASIGGSALRGRGPARGRGRGPTLSNLYAQYTDAPPAPRAAGPLAAAAGPGPSAPPPPPPGPPSSSSAAGTSRSTYPPPPPPPAAWNSDVWSLPSPPPPSGAIASDTPEAPQTYLPPPQHYLHEPERGVSHSADGPAPLAPLVAEEYDAEGAALHQASEMASGGGGGSSSAVPPPFREPPPPTYGGGWSEGPPPTPPADTAATEAEAMAQVGGFVARHAGGSAGGTPRSHSTHAGNGAAPSGGGGGGGPYYPITRVSGQQLRQRSHSGHRTPPRSPLEKSSTDMNLQRTGAPAPPGAGAVPFGQWPPATPSTPIQEKDAAAAAAAGLGSAGGWREGSGGGDGSDAITDAGPLSSAPAADDTVDERDGKRAGSPAARADGAASGGAGRGRTKSSGRSAMERLPKEEMKRMREVLELQTARIADEVRATAHQASMESRERSAESTTAAAAAAAAMGKDSKEARLFATGPAQLDPPAALSSRLPTSSTSGSGARQSRPRDQLSELLSRRMSYGSTTHSTPAPLITHSLGASSLKAAITPRTVPSLLAARDGAESRQESGAVREAWGRRSGLLLPHAAGSAVATDPPRSAVGDRSVALGPSRDAAALAAALGRRPLVIPPTLHKEQPHPPPPEEDGHHPSWGAAQAWPPQPTAQRSGAEAAAIPLIDEPKEDLHSLPRSSFGGAPPRDSAETARPARESGADASGAAHFHHHHRHAMAALETEGKRVDGAAQEELPPPPPPRIDHNSTTTSTSTSAAYAPLPPPPPPPAPASCPHHHDHHQAAAIPEQQQQHISVWGSDAPPPPSMHSPESMWVGWSSSSYDNAPSASHRAVHGSAANYSENSNRSAASGDLPSTGLPPPPPPNPSSTTQPPPPNPSSTAGRSHADEVCPPNEDGSSNFMAPAKEWAAPPTSLPPMPPSTDAAPPPPRPAVHSYSSSSQLTDLRPPSMPMHFATGSGSLPRAADSPYPTPPSHQWGEEEEPERLEDSRIDPRTGQRTPPPPGPAAAAGGGAQPPPTSPKHHNTWPPPPPPQAEEVSKAGSSGRIPGGRRTPVRCAHFLPKGRGIIVLCRESDTPSPPIGLRTIPLAAALDPAHPAASLTGPGLRFAPTPGGKARWHLLEAVSRFATSLAPRAVMSCTDFPPGAGGGGGGRSAPPPPLLSAGEVIALLEQLGPELDPTLREVLKVYVKHALGREGEGFQWGKGGRDELVRLLLTTRSSSLDEEPDEEDDEDDEDGAAPRDRSQYLVYRPPQPMPEDPASQALPPPHFLQAFGSAAVMDQLERLVCRGDRPAAAAFALQHGLYADAIIISLVCPTPEALQRTVQAYTTQFLHPFAPLSQAYRSFNELPCAYPPCPPLPLTTTTAADSSGAGHHAASAFKGPPSLRVSWRRHAALQLATYTPETIANLTTLADALASQREIQAAHTCLLLSDLCLMAKRRAQQLQLAKAAAGDESSMHSTDGASLLSEASTAAGAGAGDATSPAEQRRQAQHRAIQGRLVFLGGAFFTRCRFGFLSPVSVTLTAILQVCRCGLNLRELGSTSDGGPQQPPLHGIPGWGLRYAVGLQCMAAQWLQEVGLSEPGRELLRCVAALLPPPPPSCVSAEAGRCWGLASTVCDLAGLPLPQPQPQLHATELGGATPARASPEQQQRRPPEAVQPPRATSPGAAAAGGAGPSAGGRGSAPPPPQAQLSAVPSRTPPPPSPAPPLSAAGDAKKLMPPPPAAPAPAPAPASAEKAAPATARPGRGGKEEDPKKKAGTSRQRASSLDAIRSFFFRGRSGSSTGEGKESKEGPVKKMILDTEKPPQFDPATGRWLFEETEEEKAQAEAIRRGPPKTSKPSAAAGPPTPGPDAGGSSPSAPPAAAAPSRRLGGVGVPGGGRRIVPGGLQRRPGVAPRPQYPDMFNST